MQIREIQPAMGFRTIYEYYNTEGIGRDNFYSYLHHYGFRIKVFRNIIKTTFLSPYCRYKNLLVDKILNDVNQLWTSDLTARAALVI
jgi:hypothetical protein